MEDKGKRLAIATINRVTPHRGAQDIREYIGDTKTHHVWAWDGFGSEMERVFLCIPIDGNESGISLVNRAGPTPKQKESGLFDDVMALIRERISALDSMSVLY